jgi:hypothetical protein
MQLAYEKSLADVAPLSPRGREPVRRLTDPLLSINLPHVKWLPLLLARRVIGVNCGKTVTQEGARRIG